MKNYTNIRYDDERRALVGSMVDDTGEVIEVVLRYANLPDKDGNVFSEGALRAAAEIE